MSMTPKISPKLSFAGTLRLPILALTVIVLGGTGLTIRGASEGDMTIRCVKRPDTGSRNAFYVSNKPPLEPSPFMKLPIGAIKPKGWLRHMLELEADGMSGRMSEVTHQAKADGNAWLSPAGKGKLDTWSLEPVYWLRGFGDLGYVLGDERIIEETRRWIDGILSSQKPDGWFGPMENNHSAGRSEGQTNLPHGQDGQSRKLDRLNLDLFPNMIALQCLQTWYEFNGDKRVLPFMLQYARFVRESMLATKGPSWETRYQETLAINNLDSIYWLFNRTGESWLLDAATRMHQYGVDWTGGIPLQHGVETAEGFREPVTYWMQSKEARHFEATYHNYKTIFDEFGQVPGGMFCADEHTRKGCTDPRQAVETCSIVEIMNSFEMLTRITGDPVWADRCEEVAFNSLPASQPPDLKGVHYLTAPNCVTIDQKKHCPGVGDGGPIFLYGARCPPIPGEYPAPCCQLNVGYGWPYYAEALWLATPDNGLCASLYAASEVKARVGDGTTVTLTETTDYPFTDKATFTFAMPKAIRFPLYFRIPRWCQDLRLTLNGKLLEARAEPLSYLVIERTWTNGDKLGLELPMHLTATVWEKNKGAVSLSRGPLTFSLKIGEKWNRLGTPADKWPSWEVEPTTPWNYGLDIDPANLAASVEAIPKAGPLADQPFTPATAPIELRAKARKIPEWQLDQYDLVAVLQPSPIRTSEPIETVTLVPMGCARLRISAFPVASTSPTANKWQLPEWIAVASHCLTACESAIGDGKLPKNSSDNSIPVFGWPHYHKGTREWIDYRFTKPRTFSWSDVYWFDDIGKGSCRVPKAWQLLYKDGEEWKPVKLTGESVYGTAKDAFNKVTFEPVSTRNLRMDVQLQPQFSGGILEWRVGDKEKP